MTRIAVLGIGRMGEAAALRLVEAGHEVFVWNRTLGRTGAVVDAGAHAPADLAATVEAAEIVLTVLSDDDAVRELVLKDGGLAGLLEDRLFVDASTVSPEMCAELAEQIERYVALPIAGAPSALREGNAICLAGGASELLDEAAPVIEALSSDHLRYARPEQAAVAKIANNNLLLIGLAALAESIAIGRAGGLSDGQIRKLFDGSAMLAPGIRNRLPALLDGAGPTWWSVDLGVKDAGLAISVSRQGDVSLPLTVAACERYDAASARGLGDSDIATIGLLYRSRVDSED